MPKRVLRVRLRFPAHFPHYGSLPEEMYVEHGFAQRGPICFPPETKMKMLGVIW